MTCPNCVLVRVALETLLANHDKGRLIGDDDIDSLVKQMLQREVESLVQHLVDDSKRCRERPLDHNDDPKRHGFDWDCFINLHDQVVLLLAWVKERRASDKGAFRPPGGEP